MSRVELLCVGAELLAGQVNTHQSYLALKLGEAGLSLSRESSLQDDAAEIAAAVKEALRRSQAVIVCGGLGPTFDDLTREGAARALGRRLVYRPSLYKGILARFARYRMPVPEENRRQAFVLEGARVLANAHGSAPGQLLRLAGGKTLILLPGPFAELSPMFESEVLPFLKKTYAARTWAERLAVHLAGVPESVADERLLPVIASAGPDRSFTILAAGGQVDFHAFLRGPSRAAVRRTAREVRRRIYDRVGEFAFGEGADTLESAVGRRLQARGLSLAVAESCTGGGLGARLTAVPGSSAYFAGGVVAYANSVKERLLGVPKALLRKHGAVSGPCAEAMAEGVRRACRADLGLSITGVAGPAGGTREKPVGLVYVGLAAGRPAMSRELRLNGGRETIRARAVSGALTVLLRSLAK